MVIQGERIKELGWAPERMARLDTVQGQEYHPFSVGAAQAAVQRLTMVNITVTTVAMEASCMRCMCMPEPRGGQSMRF